MSEPGSPFICLVHGPVGVNELIFKQSEGDPLIPDGDWVAESHACGAGLLLKEDEIAG